jgi:hypothetical protein
MTNSAAIQSKIWRGYGKAAKKLGTSHQFYRPAGNLLLEGGGNLLLESGGNIRLEVQNYPGAQLFSRPVSLNAEDMKYGRPNKYGKATWYALVDGNGIEVGDYFIGPQGTFFISAMQLLLPILVVECNRVISIYKPQAQSGVGAQGYGGTTSDNQTLLVSGVPCSILQGTKGEKSETNLAGDTRSPWWSILMPKSVGYVAPDDIIIDDLGQRYIVSSNETSDLGYRATAMMALS